MSKLIVEMEMPQNCKKCPLVGMDHFGQIRCKGQGGRLIHLKNFQTEIERPSWCPIKGKLPDKHGDLIDRDALKKMKVYSPELHEYIVPLAYVDWQDTVIAAERKDDGK